MLNRLSDNSFELNPTFALLLQHSSGKSHTKLFRLVGCVICLTVLAVLVIAIPLVIFNKSDRKSEEYLRQGDKVEFVKAEICTKPRNTFIQTRSQPYQALFLLIFRFSMSYLM